LAERGKPVGYFHRCGYTQRNSNYGERGPTVELTKYRITYKNGAVEFVPAKSYRRDGPSIIFEDADGQELHRVNEREVRSIGRADAIEVPNPMLA
jgi:hypothetical protein